MSKNTPYIIGGAIAGAIIIALISFTSLTGNETETNMQMSDVIQEDKIKVKQSRF